MARSPRNQASYPPLYTPFKWASARLVARLRASRLSTNVVTVIWGTLLVGASFALALEHRAATSLLVLAAILLDCIDGDLARSRDQLSVSGTLLEQVAHWIGNMALIAGAGSALLLADSRPSNVLLVSSLTVTQATYIAVVRQIWPNATSIPEHPRLRRAFRVIVRILWLASPIELPLTAALIVFGPSRGTLFALVVTLLLASLALFVPHFLLIRATDRRTWARGPESRSGSDPTRASSRRVLAADWWVPGAPHLPGDVLALLGAQAVPSGAPLLRTVRRDLDTILPELFRTAGRVLALGCPEEAALEAVVSAVSGRGDSILIIGGRSAVRRWKPIIEGVGRAVTVSERAFGHVLDPAALARDIAQGPSPMAIVLVMADPEDGTLTDIPAVQAAVRDPSAIVILDATLSLCVDEVRMDEWGVDVTLTSSASGVMAPQGLCLVALGPRVLAALETLRPGGAGGCLDLSTLVSGRRPAPVPASALLGLQVSASMIQATGLDLVIQQSGELAERFRQRCAAEACLTPVAQLCTAACTTFRLPEAITPAQVQERLWTWARIVVGHGRTPEGGATINVGHSGHRTPSDMDRAAGALAKALRASGRDVRQAERVDACV